MSQNDLHPLTADGGIQASSPDVEDPFARLDDLMQVIEALCPIYPERETFTHAGEFKL